MWIEGKAQFKGNPKMNNNLNLHKEKTKFYILYAHIKKKKV